MNEGTVYTETVVHSAPEQFVSEAPYQLVIVQLTDRKITARITGERVQIGDRVVFMQDRGGIPFFQKA